MVNNKEIKYNGYSAQPSDYECQDGELAVAINLIHEDGALKPILPPKITDIKLNYENAFLHKTSVCNNYISYSKDKVKIEWVASDNDIFSEPIPFSLPQDTLRIIDIAAMGNILIVSSDSGLHYIRFVAVDHTYVYLGSKIPDIPIDFGLKLNYDISEERDGNFEIRPAENDDIYTPDDFWETLCIKSYDLSVSKGDFLRENYPFPNISSDFVATHPIPFDTSIILEAGKEYKFAWQPLIGRSEVRLRILGKKKGTTEYEQLYWTARELTTEYIIEGSFTPQEEWTDLAFQIYFRHLDFKYEHREAGNITFMTGIDNSETADGEQVRTVIKYTPESLQSLLGSLNKYTNEAHENSKFIYPFFLRYAVRLFDGSYAYISDPQLMIPNSEYAPAILFSGTNKAGTKLVLSSFNADILWKNRNQIPDIWEDIITGIDIFVSTPIWRYDQGVNFDTKKNLFKYHSTYHSIGYGIPYVGEIQQIDSFVACDLYDFNLRLNEDTEITFSTYLKVAQRSDSDIKGDITKLAIFYKVSSLEFAELNNSNDKFAVLDIANGTLNNLVTLEPLEDTTLPYKGFINARLKEYNHRLNLFDTSIILRDPSAPRQIFNFLDVQDNYTIQIYVRLVTEEGEKWVADSGLGETIGPWYFYPDSRAKELILYFLDQTGEVTGKASIPLKTHDFLNGSYWYSGNFSDYPSIEPCTGKIPLMPQDNIIKSASTIYLSNTNCPFAFQSDYCVSIGVSEIIGLASAAKALSQGQFGQFPLYAFTTEGVWALEVSATGTYSARQPITRDVCINADGITQLDNAVLFPTDRGIMLISGSQTQCISDAINSEYPFDALSLPGFGKLHDMLEHNPGNDKCLPTLPFTEFLKQCRMIYDYVHQRVIVYAPGITYAYMFSLKSKMWGMTFSNIVSHLNSYPEALAVDEDNNIVNFSESDANDVIVMCLAVTRPLKLDSANIHKTIDNIIQRGNFAKGHVQSALYGSRDLINWHLVWSSKDHFLRGFRGTPYKYFRVALLCKLSPDESIYGASVQFTPRLTNQPR